jgi:two-component system response regulator PilR (NtrC family)
MRLGAYDYIRKPFDTELIRSVVCRAIEQRLIFKSSSEELRGELSYKSEIIGNNPLMQEVFSMIKRIAPTDSTVLIQGESGTGKELVARAIHYRSYRRDKVFLSVNCSAFTESLLESELFGHVRGAFTGAVEDKKGLFQAANHGTLFLDEVADMSLTTQVKMLRVLEERKVSRVGSTSSEPIDVRIIAATNKELEEEVRRNHFREDLFYRLNVIPIYLPSLRERKDDIPLLAGYFLAKYSRSMGKSVTSLSREAKIALEQSEWPGNVRELENVIQRHVALCQGSCIERIQSPRLSRSAQEQAPPRSTRPQMIPETGIHLESLLEDFERKHIQEALKATAGNLTNAAKLLGMSYRSIRYRVKKLGLKVTSTV